MASWIYPSNIFVTCCINKIRWEMKKHPCLKKNAVGLKTDLLFPRLVITVHGCLASHVATDDDPRRNNDSDANSKIKGKFSPANLCLVIGQ